MTTRIDQRFADLKRQGRAGLVTFITAGDPDLATSSTILSRLAAAGADLIELGMPFSDPMAEGPPVQLSSQRALKAGMTLKKTLAMVRAFRAGDQATPIILMGYYNPVYSFGVERFLDAAKEAGVDGLIIVDCPPEHDDEVCLPAQAKGINFIRLATPTTDARRLPAVIANTSGFVYYVSIAGVTGAKSAELASVETALARFRTATDLPICVGFGIRTPEQAAAFARVGDGVVVGSALVSAIRDSLDDNGQAGPLTVDAVLDLVSALAKGVRSARLLAAE